MAFRVHVPQPGPFTNSAQTGGSRHRLRNSTPSETALYWLVIGWWAHILAALLIPVRTLLRYSYLGGARAVRHSARWLTKRKSPHAGRHQRAEHQTR